LKALFAILLALAAPAEAAIVTSARPDALSVTVYRNPDRADGDAMELSWLQGFALITETRTIDLPAGPAEIRFEGVASGIIPVSAIVSGLPGGVAEKNRDARLLSPAALIDGYLGRRVHLRRTNRATGAVRESDAVIRSGPNGVILQTADGIEALSCSGLPERIVYDGVPQGLSAKPTLAVTTDSPTAKRTTVTLSYLADDFDWQANYVAHVARDGRTLDLFAWLTLANGNEESFPNAQTQAVAGTLNREDDATPGNTEFSARLDLACWPMGTTSDGIPVPLPPPPPAAGAGYGGMEDIIVTAQRRQESLMPAPVAMTAQQEELGDLKLYRIPEAVTVAAFAQKQIALLARENVPFDRLYAACLGIGSVQDPKPASIMMRMKNVKEKGLGLPLPSGGVAIFEQPSSRPMLAGEARIKDTAIGEEIELIAGSSAQVQVTQRQTDGGKDDDVFPRRYAIDISNANAVPATVEIAFIRSDGSLRLISPSHKLGTRNGRIVWTAKIPANGRATLAYTLARDPDDEN
jgi:hypothetical protein